MVELPAGSSVPVHSHEQEQAGIVLEGQVEFVIGGESQLPSPGDMYIIPSHVEHAVPSIPVRSKLLDIYNPPREELMR